MRYILTSLVLLMTNHHPSIQQNLYRSIQNELKGLNVSCPEFDSCAYRLGQDSLLSNTCHCAEHCAILGTCCLDSLYIDVPQPNLKPVCRAVYNGNSYFMVDRCPSRDDAFENFCQRDWKGENDVMRIVPVTSLRTSITYKNYFCFRCHETTDDFLYWSIEITSDFLSESNFEEEEGDDYILSSLRYDKDEKSWMILVQQEHTVLPFPVNISMLVPNEISSLGWDCELDVISTCAKTWSDAAVREKCQAYTALKYVRAGNDTVKYRNLHCALCNSVDLKEVSCTAFTIFSEKRPFNFRDLLNLNRSNKENKPRSCEKDHVWDPYGKRCLKITCAFPGYKVKDGKCVRG